MWLARNKNNTLKAFSFKPLYSERLGVFYIPIQTEEEMFEDNVLRLDSSEFPEVTFENSPMEIKSFKDACTKFIVSNMESEIVIHTETPKKMMDKWDKVFKEYNEKYEDKTSKETPKGGI